MIEELQFYAREAANGTRRFKRWESVRSPPTVPVVARAA